MKRSTARDSCCSPLLAAAQLQGCVRDGRWSAPARRSLSSDDRRTTGAQIEDEDIELRGDNRINDRFGDKVHVNVTSLQPQRAAHRRGARRRGHGGDREDRARHAQRARRHQRAADRRRHLAHLRAPTTRYLTSKVKARFIDANKFNAHPRQGGDRDGVVYLLGLVTRAGGRRRGGNRAHHRRRAQGGASVRVLQADRRDLRAAAAVQAGAKPQATVIALSGRGGRPHSSARSCRRREAARWAARLPRPLVFTNGVFDILHRGHVTYLAQARALGASLVVGAQQRRLGAAPRQGAEGARSTRSRTAGGGRRAAGGGRWSPGSTRTRRAR